MSDKGQQESVHTQLLYIHKKMLKSDTPKQEFWERFKMNILFFMIVCPKTF